MLLGAFYHYPSYFDTQEAQALSEADFPDPLNKMAYSIMFNLFSIGYNKFTDGAIESYIQGKPSLYKFYNTKVEQFGNEVKQGAQYFENLNKHGDKDLFTASIQKIKKFSLLRNLEKNGVSVKEFYDWDATNDKIIESQNIWLEQTSLEEIANLISDKISIIMDKSSTNIDRISVQAGEGLRDLITSFDEEPDFGSPLPIASMNTITRGARLGKFYIRSAPTGGGKLVVL